MNYFEYGYDLEEQQRIDNENYLNKVERNVDKKVDKELGKKKKINPIEQDSRSIDELIQTAQNLIRQNVEVLKRPTIIRNQALAKKLSLRDKDVFRILNKARNNLRKSEEGESPDVEFDIKEEKYLCNNLIAENTLNLVVSMPKVGKSSLISAFLGALTAGNTEFLEQGLLGGVRSIYICGTDQPLGDWMQILMPVGLAAKTSKGKGVIKFPLKKLWHKGKPIYLTEEYIQKLEELAKADPNSIFVFDAFASLLSGTGLDENHVECVEPVRMLFEALVPTGATLILLHHEGSTNSHRRASEASRGTNALPAEASQILQLNWLNPENKDDNRISVSTQGRNSKPVDMVIEQIDRAVWVNHGNTAEIQEEIKLEKIIDGLTERQHDVYQIIEEHPLDFITPTELSKKVEFAEKEKTNLDLCRRTLDQLVKKRLVENKRTSTDKAVENRYRKLR